MQSLKQKIENLIQEKTKIRSLNLKLITETFGQESLDWLFSNNIQAFRYRQQQFWELPNYHYVNLKNGNAFQQTPTTRVYITLNEQDMKSIADEIELLLKCI